MATIEQIQDLLIENNKIIGKTIAKINNELLRKIAILSNPKGPSSDKVSVASGNFGATTAKGPRGATTRTRTITPVSDEERCTKTLVSGKNKGSQCSKKATVDSLCTIHNKKINPPIALSDEFVPEYIIEQERAEELKINEVKQKLRESV
jgi:hypothetical protein